MKTAIAIAIATTCTVAAATAHAQLDLPRPSPFAHVTQTVGLTDITIDYSSPAVKGRAIWGGLVPYDKVWRTGANTATKITFSKDVSIDGKPVPAGSYAIFTIPGKSTWTVILSKKTEQFGSFTYKDSDDLLRITVTPTAIPLRERLAFVFADFSDSLANVDLEWEKLRVRIPVVVKTEEQTMAAIKGMTDAAWRPFAQAARFVLENKKDADAALALVEKSIALKEEWLNDFTKAQILAVKGKTKDAIALAEKAQAMGSKDMEHFFMADEVKKAISDWKAAPAKK